ncbi:sulfate permease 2 [Cordyceps fumosorosea ARSEF 2679]|uniref:Sulfate permease 2 n=1 Tax=Cordyceps fumosorosea (strain ARSEF 2679) TaxID=1081104 RepID=A0A167TQ10_CORFA|nr:sulfate permease 2 [Cordyceps fumosorosea ARSEF 2679]OAA60827.1 sulfate permease 2 [Cordyceps fumosorosea ARSEF 2679]
MASMQPASPFAIFAIFTGLAFMVICIALDRSIVATAIPKITSEFHSLPDVGWYGSAYLMTTCCLQLFFGKLYAEFQVKWVFLSALVIFEVGSVICAAAPSSVVLIVGRAIAGAGCAGLMSGAFILFRFFIPVNDLPKYTGALGGMSGIAQVIAPTLGGVFTDKLSWRWCFWINLPIGGITFLVILLLVHVPPETKVIAGSHSLRDFISRFDLVGTLLFIPTIVCLLLALQWGGVRYDWGEWRIVLLLALFEVLLFAWAVSQYLQGDRATVPLSMIKQRSLAGGAFFVFCFFAAFFVITYYVPIWFQAVRGASAYASGINMLAASAAMSVAVIGSGFIVTRVGYYVPNMIVSVIVTSIGCGLVYTFDRHTSTTTWAAALVVTGLGIGLGIQQPLIAVQTIFQDAELAVATSIVIFLQSLAGTVFISVAQNVFQGKVQDVIRQSLPDVDPADVLGVGASDLGVAMGRKYPDKLGAILDSYNDGLRSVFLISVVLACVSIVSLPLMEWRSVKSTEKPAQDGEILVGILSHLPVKELLKTSLLCRQLYSLAVHTLQQRLLAVSSIPGHELILESFHPSRKLTTPYLTCRPLGTRHPTDCDPSSSASAGTGPASLGRVCQLYASFRPVVTEENRRRRFRMVWPVSIGSSSKDTDLDEDVPLDDEVQLDDGVRFSQLCVVLNLVTRGRFVTHHTVSEHVVRVFRGWLDDMAGSSGRAGDDEGKIPLSSERLLWVDPGKTMALRFRVAPGPAERMPLLSVPGEEELARSYTLTYQELLIRSTSLLMAVEASASKEMEPSRNSIILASTGS